MKKFEDKKLEKSKCQHCQADADVRWCVEHYQKWQKEMTDIGFQKGWKEHERMMAQLEDFKKTGIPKCTTCGKPMKKLNDYEWETDCEHMKGMILSVG